MKYYKRLAEKQCFTREEVVALTGNYNTAGSVLKNYQKKGYVRQVRRNLYVMINLADRQPVASKFLIAGRITPTAYVSHHSAFEYYGCANQVSSQVEVSSETPFVSFSFAGNTFTYIASRIQDGVITNWWDIRITDIERAVVDGINDFEKVMGLEELLRCLLRVVSVREGKLLGCLAAYGKQALYQKAGYILRHFKGKWNLSDDFFSECAARIGKSTRYLTKNHEGNYDAKWQLVAPADLMGITSKMDCENAELR
ncbi:MAG: transcriptional regulator [Deltaproteobacteria bacterium]|jgi:predicted transcriptional regulator of viral defense system|nr:transcriptional regulator [Deltaproteobacteria bacterium]